MFSYRQLLQTVLLFLLLFPHGTSTDISNGSVFWTLKTISAVFGNDVQLQCHVGLETTGRARQWSRGKDQRLLIFNGNSTNEDKYTEAYHKTLSVLTIKNFEIDDVNIKYVCQQGFSTYSNTLKLMPDIFEYIPRRNGTVISQKAGQISITFDRVYPVPSCTALLGSYDFRMLPVSIHTQSGEIEISGKSKVKKQNLTDKVKIESIPNESIYKSVISLTYSQASEESSRHHIDLVCLVGTKEIKHSFEIPSNGNIEQKVKDQTLGEIGRGVFATVFAFSFIAFIVPLSNGWFPAS